MKIKLHVWRQKNAKSAGKLETYSPSDVNPNMSFLEMLDVLNEDLIKKGEDAISFDHDCREGICGSCSMVINGRPHGPSKGTTACQLHMRSFKEGDELYIEPWRAGAFPVVKDLIVDRTPFDRIMAKGGFVSVNTGSAQDANALPISKDLADKSFEAAACIGCGACVAACKNSSAMLFVSTKVSQLALLPQGQPERMRRALGMLRQHDEEGFGACTNTKACEAACPKEISIENIARLNRDFMKATLFYPEHETSASE
ncbi:MAG: succinate dehydrogenase/fumarate reductase iron-sulfur subunit [Pseudomonadota bacterium]